LLLWCKKFSFIFKFRPNKRKLGTGRFGDVWLVYDEKDDSDKTMKKIYVGSAEVDKQKKIISFKYSYLKFMSNTITFFGILKYIKITN
jgi:hypothetical protein